MLLFLLDNLLRHVHVLIPLDLAPGTANDLGSLVAERVILVQLVRQVIRLCQYFIFKVVICAKLELYKSLFTIIL